MREIKFRAWEPEHGVMSYSDNWTCLFNKAFCNDDPIMQFTGIKDKNGIEIYEGDIVNFKIRIIGDRYSEENLQVSFKSGCFIIKQTHILSDWYMLCEVIGNIYENPELLKDKE